MTILYVQRNQSRIFYYLQRVWSAEIIGTFGGGGGTPFMLNHFPRYNGVLVDHSRKGFFPYICRNSQSMSQRWDQSWEDHTTLRSIQSPAELRRLWLYHLKLEVIIRVDGPLWVPHMLIPFQRLNYTLAAVDIHTLCTIFLRDNFRWGNSFGMIITVYFGVHLYLT